MVIKYLSYIRTKKSDNKVNNVFQQAAGPFGRLCLTRGKGLLIFTQYYRRFCNNRKCLFKHNFVKLRNNKLTFWRRIFFLILAHAVFKL